MEKMLGIREAKGSIIDLLEKLSGPNGEEWLKNFKRFLRKENPFEINKVMAGGNYFTEISDWQNFWQKITGQEYDFSKIVIPEKPEGKWRFIIIVDILLETLYAKCKDKFPCWRWTDGNLDGIVTENERDAKDGAYAIWVQDVVEADEDLKNLSANAVKTKGVTTETLAERLIHELKFFSETGCHLDINNVTLCAGSRDCDGRVPDVDWSGVGKLGVDWDDPDNAHDHLRARRVVS